MDLLVTHLDTYSRLGIPKLHHLVAFEAEDEVEEGNKNRKELLLCLDNFLQFQSFNQSFNLDFPALYSLEEDWTDIVRNSHMLSEKARSQQTALWELVETEVAYIRTLKVIQDVSCIPKTQKIQKR